MSGIFTAVCPACAGLLEPAPEPPGTSTGLNVCTTCGRMYLVHVGYAIPVSPSEHIEV